MFMWFRMATVSMQPWQIYLLYLIVYKSEPHTHYITLTIVLVYICYVFGFGTFNNDSTERTQAVDYRLVLTYLAETKQVLLKTRFMHLYNQPSLYIMLDIIGRLPIYTCPCISVVMM
ncbi:hypothetical protein Hanom_Chr17g01554041 [Helianthus anomalus]